MTAPLRSRSVRWAVPVAVAAVVAAVASGAFRASADIGLPSRSAAELLADIETASVPAFTGTVVEKAALGLPDLPTQAQAGASSSSSGSMLGMLTGSHTAKIWYGGPTQQRIALLDTVGESDVFHNGTDVWQWDSNSRTATHLTLPSPASRPAPTATGMLAPDQLAKQALAAIDPTTKVSIDAERVVADQKAYELVLEPRDASSRVGSVRISIDGSTKLPLGVQVFGRDDPGTAALDVSFTSINYEQPDQSMFAFTPPEGATVAPPAQHQPEAGHPAGTQPQVLGSGWTSIVFLRAPADTANPMLSSLTEVSGSWGRGRLLDSALLSALITDDGRVFVGPVDPSALYAAADANK